MTGAMWLVKSVPLSVNDGQFSSDLRIHESVDRCFGESDSFVRAVNEM